MLTDSMDKLYTQFEQNFALSWAGSHFSVWYQQNPTATPDEQYDQFCNYVEGGLSAALKFRQENT